MVAIYMYGLGYASILRRRQGQEDGYWPVIPVADRARTTRRRVLRTAGLHPKALVQWWIILAVAEQAFPTQLSLLANAYISRR